MWSQLLYCINTYAYQYVVAIKLNEYFYCKRLLTTPYFCSSQVSQHYAVRQPSPRTALPRHHVRPHRPPQPFSRANQRRKSRKSSTISQKTMTLTVKWYRRTKKSHDCILGPDWLGPSCWLGPQGLEGTNYVDDSLLPIPKNLSLQFRVSLALNKRFFLLFGSIIEIDRIFMCDEPKPHHFCGRIATDLQNTVFFVKSLGFIDHIHPFYC